MPYPLSLFKNVNGNLVQHFAHDKEREEHLRKDGFVAMGEGPFADPAAPKEAAPEPVPAVEHPAIVEASPIGGAPEKFDDSQATDQETREEEAADEVDEAVAESQVKLKPRTRRP